MALYTLLLCGVAVGQTSKARQDDYYSAVGAGARELNRQLDAFQRALATIPGPDMGRGLYKQSNGVLFDLVYLQEQIRKKAAPGLIHQAFDKMEQKLHTMLGNTQDLEKWDPALRAAAKQVIAADHDLQFALFGGSVEVPADRKSQTAYGQTLVLVGRLDTLQGLARFVFEGQGDIEKWNADFKTLREQLAVLQKLVQNKASAEELKAQFRKTDAAWETIVARFKALTDDLRLLLRLRVGETDEVFARLAPLFGVTDRRAPLKTDFSSGR
jgi:hypothetical protein